MFENVYHCRPQRRGEVELRVVMAAFTGKCRRARACAPGVILVKRIDVPVMLQKAPSKK